MFRQYSSGDTLTSFILLCVFFYLSYQLSYRDLVEMMDERGLKIAHSTILRWVLKYSMEKETSAASFEKWNRSWRMDETYIKVNGAMVNTCLRAVDSNGETIDFYLSHTRIQPQPSDSLSAYVTIDHPIK